jgi:serine/threonine protein kinase
MLANIAMIGQLLDSRYLIVQVLSAGGFGPTYIAEDTKRPGKPQCVVKQLRLPTKNPNTFQIHQRLFQTEAEILEKLGQQHDQIPRLLAYFEYNQDFYLVQEFICGHPLSEEILLSHPLSEDQVINLLIEVLEVLEFVHKQGVIHRDIKPANLMRRETDGKIVLIDFGSVKEIATPMLSSHQQNTSTVAIGTPGYIPIEQLDGHPQFNSDIYALGIVSIQALTGLSVKDISKLRDSNHLNTCEIFWRHQAQVSQELANVINSMVRLDYRRRYQSASEVLKDLRNLIKKRQLPTFILDQSHQQLSSHLRKNLWLMLAAVGTVAVIMTTNIDGFDFHNPRVERMNQEDYFDAPTDLDMVIRHQPGNSNVDYQRCVIYYLEK